MAGVKQKRPNIIVAMECYIRKGNKYLMLHRAKNKRIMPDTWMAPGGKIDFGEGLFAATRREIQEETGLEIKNLKLRVMGSGYLKDLNEEIYFFFVTADYADGKVNKDCPEGELVWLTEAEILKLPNLLAELEYVLPLMFKDEDRVLTYTVEYEKGNDINWIKIEEP